MDWIDKWTMSVFARSHPLSPSHRAHDFFSLCCSHLRKHSMGSLKEAGIQSVEKKTGRKRSVGWWERIGILSPPKTGSGDPKIPQHNLRPLLHQCLSENRGTVCLWLAHIKEFIHGSCVFCFCVCDSVRKVKGRGGLLLRLIQRY